MVERWRVDRIRHPVLPLSVALDDSDALVYVGLGGSVSGLAQFARRHAARLEPERRATTQARCELYEYLAGKRRTFELQLRLLGTEFQRQAWLALCQIPYGSTRSYGEQARAVGRPAAARAVGRANATNPIPVVVPCHRVIGADGSLTGFGGGLPAKRWLLELESGNLSLFGDRSSHRSDMSESVSAS